MLPTPSTSHVSFDTIYEPAEDSFLLLDTLSGDTESAWLRERFSDQSSSPLVAEVGVGSGVVIAFLAAHSKVILGRDDILAIGVDVNLNACNATEITVQKALADEESGAIYLGSICADLCNSLATHCVDLLIFNPPYVPTPELPILPPFLAGQESQFEIESRLLALSYAGGHNGMVTTDRLLRAVPNILSPEGVAYVLFCAQNKPEDVKTRIRNDWSGDWSVETVGRSGKAAGWEKLEVLKLWRE